MHTIKLRRAARLSSLSRYPRTWDALLSRIPDDIKAALTARQIAALAASLHAQYNAGHTAGWQDMR
jgi:hypothetical protein